MRDADAFMHAAFLEAERAFSSGEVPIGAVIVRQGEVIARAHNETRTHRDPTLHAEMLAIRRACRALGQERLTGCDIYVTLEPCPMCAQAASFARLRRLTFAAYDPKGGAVEHNACLYHQPSCHHAPEVIGGLLETEACALLQRFFETLRA